MFPCLRGVLVLQLLHSWSAFRFSREGLSWISLGGSLAVLIAVIDVAGVVKQMGLTFSSQKQKKRL